MKTSQTIRIRLDKRQAQLLENQISATGHKTISSYVRSKLFDSDLSAHEKLNRILELLEDNQEADNK